MKKSIVNSIRVTIDGFAQTCKDWDCDAHKHLLYAKAFMGKVLGVLSPGGGYPPADHPSEIPPTRQLSYKAPQLDTLKNINNLRADIEEMVDEMYHYWEEEADEDIAHLVVFTRAELMKARFDLGFLLSKIREEWYEEHAAEAYMQEMGLTVEDLYEQARVQEEYLKDEDYLTGEDLVPGVPYPEWKKKNP